MKALPLFAGVACLVAASSAFAVGPRASQPAPPLAPSAPSLSAAALRTEAQDSLARIAVTLDDTARARLVGAYLAFESGGSDLNAMAACDDDGDPVVVLSDSLLALVDFASVAQSMDEALATHKVDDYARFLGEQTGGARVMPPPPGFFDATATHDPRVVAREAPRRRAMIDALVDAEVAHFALGDLACPRPTATMETGDGTWTDAEARAARASAARVYTPEHVAAADEFATRALVLAGAPRDVAVGSAPRASADSAEAAYVAILTLLDRVPATTYARFHGAPPLAQRLAVVRAAARASAKP